MEKKNRGVGVIVGRWQSPYLHEGHKHLINTALSENDRVVIVIGCTKGGTVDERNPYDFAQRLNMIRRQYPDTKKVTFDYIIDVDDDKKWSDKLDDILDQYIHDSPTLYGSRDSFISHYKGSYAYREVEEIPNVSATKIREELNG